MLNPEAVKLAQVEALTLASDLYKLYETLADAGVDAEPLGHACDCANDLSTLLGNPDLYAEAPVPAVQAA